MIAPPVAAKSRLLLLGLPLVVALHLGLFWLDHRPSPRRMWGDEVTYLEEARSLAAGRPRSPDQLLWPPGYPWFLAAVLGASGGSLVAVRLIQTALLAAAALLLRAIAGRLLASPFAADLAALFTLGYPPLAAFAHYLWPEVLHLALVLAAVWIVLARRASAGWLALAGLLLGLALSTKTLLGPFLPLLLLPVAREGGWRRGLPRAALAATVSLATVLPAMVVNHRQAGVFTLADNVRFNLWLGLEDTSRREFAGDNVPWREYEAWRASAPDLAGRDRVLDGKIRRRLAERGLPAVLAGQLGRQYFRLFDKDSVLTSLLPGGDLAARPARPGYRDAPPWAAALLRWGSWTAYAALLAAAACGAALLPPRRAGGWTRLALAFVAYNLLLFLGLHVKTRYRVQLLPVAFLYAAGAVAWLRARWEGSGAVAASRPAIAVAGRPVTAAIAVAAGAAALLLFLAFGGPLLD
jgi:hypothetical protein